MQKNKFLTFIPKLHFPETCIVTTLSVVYGSLSILMVFVNKLILNSGKEISAVNPENLLIIQCAISAILIFILSFILKFPISLKFKDFQVCFLINLAFIGVMLANSYSLRHLSIHMVTLLKCLSVVVTAIGDRIFLKHHFPPIIWGSLVLIVIGSCLGLLTDIEFSFVGYFWMFLSIIFASVYVLLTKVLVSHRNLHFFTAVFWNNFLSTLLLTIFSCFVLKYVFPNKKRKSPFEMLWLDSEVIWLSPLFIIFSGVLGLILNLSTFSLLGATSATSYVVVGASKKILQAILSFVVFNAKTNFTNIISVSIGLSGSTLYAYAKWKESKFRESIENDQKESNACLMDHKNSLVDLSENVNSNKI